MATCQQFIMFTTLLILICQTTHILGAVYSYYSSNGDDNCTNAGSNDICHLYCDQSIQTHKIFECGNSGQCVFHCINNYCLQNGTLNSMFTNNLLVDSVATNCMLGSTINVPNYGNAQFTTSIDEGLRQMTVNSGSNTQNIKINCSVSFANQQCRDITVNAETAQYLEITVGLDAFLKGSGYPSYVSSIIKCPKNSNYIPSPNTPYTAPCIIDMSNGWGTLRRVNIYADYGMPHDIQIIYGDGSIVTNTVQIFCVDGTSIAASGTFSSTDICWITYNPTTDPTINPTIAPTVSSTSFSSTIIATTISPTKLPTNNPITIKPTTNPTKSPSNTPIPSPTLTAIPTKQPIENTLHPHYSTNIPSNNPTTNKPTAIPSKLLSDDPTNFPSNNPTTIPSKLSSDDPTNFPSLQPSLYPTIPSKLLSDDPTNFPSLQPSLHPTKPSQATLNIVYTSDGDDIDNETTTMSTTESNDDESISQKNEDSVPFTLMVDFALIGLSVFLIVLCGYIVLLLRKKYRLKRRKAIKDITHSQHMHKISAETRNTTDIDTMEINKHNQDEYNEYGMIKPNLTDCIPINSNSEVMSSMQPHIISLTESNISAVGKIEINENGTGSQILIDIHHENCSELSITGIKQNDLSRQISDDDEVPEVTNINPLSMAGSLEKQLGVLPMTIKEQIFVEISENKPLNINPLAIDNVVLSELNNSNNNKTRNNATKQKEPETVSSERLHKHSNAASCSEYKYKFEGAVDLKIADDAASVQDDNTKDDDIKDDECDDDAPNRLLSVLKYKSEGQENKEVILNDDAYSVYSVVDLKQKYDMKQNDTLDALPTNGNV